LDLIMVRHQGKSLMNAMTARASSSRGETIFKSSLIMEFLSVGVFVLWDCGASLPGTEKESLS
jgi:hypothetical protein